MPILFLLGSSIAMFEFLILDPKALVILTYVGSTLANTLALQFR